MFIHVQFRIFILIQLIYTELFIICSCVFRRYRILLLLGANEEPLKLEKGQTMRPILKNTTDLDAIENTSESQNTEILTTTLAPTTTGTTTPTSTTATPKTSTTTTLLNSKVNANALPTTGVNTEATQGTVSQTTIASKSSAKSENISNQRDDVLGTGEVVYKEELTDSEHIKFIYSTSGVMPNETLTEGINAGTFTDKGAIESMDDCVKSCGQTSNCDIAFKLGKQCFGVACYSPDTCHTKPAFSSYYNPEIAIVKHRAVKTLRNKGKYLSINILFYFPASNLSFCHSYGIRITKSLRFFSQLIFVNPLGFKFSLLSEFFELIFKFSLLSEQVFL